MLDDRIRSLPEDIQMHIYTMTMCLRKPKKVLSDSLQFQIQHHRGIFYKILSRLHEENSELMHIRYKSYSFLAYKMVFVLNDYMYTENHVVNNTVRYLFDGLSDCEIYVYHQIDTYLIYDEQSMVRVVRFITKCWSLMNPKQRLQLNSLRNANA